MGIFNTVKLAFHAVRETRRFAKNLKEQQKRYAAMTLSEAQTLDDETLFECVFTRLASVDSWEDARRLTHPAQLVYVVQQYEVEVNNGGLCQYFVNSSRETAPFLVEALEAIGAQQHCAHFRRFVTDNGIDPAHLESFIIESVDEYEAQTQRYPFDAFDDAFYGLEEPLDDLCARYIRAHLNDFFE